MAGDAVAVGAFTAALFWFYAAVLRRIRRRDPEIVPMAAAYAALGAPFLWYLIYRLLPFAKFSWIPALVLGLILAPGAAVAAASLLRRPKVATVCGCFTALVLLGYIAVTWLEQTRPEAPDRANFILITLDTTRADRIGCYGHRAARTPTLDGLAAKGVKFDPALCLEPITAPSHATIMTSLYPETTGVVLNAMKLRPDVPTLSESFREAGYATAAFVASSSVYGRDTGLDRGFETYDDAVTPREAYRASPWAPWAIAEKLSLLAQDDNPAERPADEITDAALKWVRRRPRRPFFLWLHYFDPHDDYLPPRAYAPRGLGGRPSQGKFNRMWADNEERPKLPELISALYDGEIAFVDAELGRFLRELERLGLADRTVVLVVGDHGEAFGEHGTKYHGFRLYREETEVPFIVCDLGGGLPDLHLPPLQVSTLDVAPTLLNLAGLPVPRRMRGRAIFGDPAGAPPTPPAAYGLCLPDPLRESKYALGRLEMLARPGEKLIVSAGGEAELYNLRDDPRETRNLAAEEPDRLAEARAALDAIRATVDPAPSPTRELDPKTVDKLRALGYIK